MIDPTMTAATTYNHVAETYAQNYFDDLSDAQFIDRWLKTIPNGGSILDVGSGPGTYSNYLLQKGFDVTGIDFSEKMIEISQQKVPGGSFQFMDMRYLTFPDESFDGILASYSLIHITTTDITATLSGFLRVLKPGGMALFLTQEGEADQLVDEPYDPNHKMFYNFFTPDRLNQLLQTAGFVSDWQEIVPSNDPDSMCDNYIVTAVRKN